MPRPSREAAKQVSYKDALSLSGDEDDDSVSNVKGDGSNSKGKKPLRGPKKRAKGDEDDDDSDVYIEVKKSKSEDENDEEDLLEDEDEDERSEEGSDDEVEPIKKSRRNTRKPSNVVASEGRHVNGTGRGYISMENLTIETAPSSAPKNDKPRRVNTARPDYKARYHKSGGLAPNPDWDATGWSESWEGPQGKDLIYNTMSKEAQMSPVHTAMRSWIKDFELEKDMTVIAQHLPDTTPITTITMEDHVATAGDGDEAMEVDGRKHLTPLTGTHIPKRGKQGQTYLLNTGISVWGLDWCPLVDPELVVELGSQKFRPEGAFDYLAVGGQHDTADISMASDRVLLLNAKTSFPGVIQFWKVNCENKNGGPVVKPKGAEKETVHELEMVLLHTYGSVLDLKWCPNGGFLAGDGSPGSLDRLGILAATFSDGSLRIFNIPDPASLRHELNLDKGETIYFRVPEPYVTLSFEETGLWEMSWGTHHRLAAGCKNGCVAAWDMELILNLPHKDRMSKVTHDDMFPFRYFPAHDNSTRGVEWIRSKDCTEIPWQLITYGYDGRIRIYDLLQPFYPIDLKVYQAFPMTAIYVPWGDMFVIPEHDNSIRVEQVYEVIGSMKCFIAQGTTWSLSYSNYHPYLAQASAEGRVRMVNPTVPFRKGFGVLQHSISCLTSEPVLEDDDEENDSSPGQQNSKKVAIKRLKGDWGECDSFTYAYHFEPSTSTVNNNAAHKGYEPNMAIQRVQWSNSFHSATWIAAGGANGLVRIDDVGKPDSGPMTKKRARQLANKAKLGSAPSKVTGTKLIGRPPKNEADLKFRKRPSVAKKQQGIDSDEDHGDERANIEAPAVVEKKPKGRPKKVASAVAPPTPKTSTNTVENNSTTPNLEEDSVLANRRPVRATGKIHPMFYKEAAVSESIEEEEDARHETPTKSTKTGVATPSTAVRGRGRPPKKKVAEASASAMEVHGENEVETTQDKPSPTPSTSSPKTLTGRGRKPNATVDPTITETVLTTTLQRDQGKAAEEVDVTMDGEAAASTRQSTPPPPAASIFARGSTPIAGGEGGNRARSATPSTPPTTPKKKKTYMTKKRIAELAQSQPSLKAMWGMKTDAGGSGNNSAAEGGGDGEDES